MGAVTYDLIILLVHIEFEKDLWKSGEYPCLGTRGFGMWVLSEHSCIFETHFG